MKSRNAYITRTFIYLDIEALVVNTETEQVESVSVKIKKSDRCSPKSKENAVQRALGDTRKLIKIKSETEVSELRGMIVDDFLNKSIVLSDGTNDETEGGDE